MQLQNYKHNGNEKETYSYYFIVYTAPKY